MELREIATPACQISPSTGRPACHNTALRCAGTISYAPRNKPSEDLSVQYAKACLDPLFTDRAQWLNESKGFAKNINLSEEYRRCLNNFFLIIVLAAFTYRKILAYRLTVKNLIHMSRH